MCLALPVGRGKAQRFVLFLGAHGALVQSFDTHQLRRADTNNHTEKY